MNWLDSSHQIIAAIICLTWFTGAALLVFRRKGKEIEWISLVMLGLLAITLLVDLFFMDRDMPAGAQKIWARGWIGPRDQAGAITIGILEDPLGLTFSALSPLLGLFLLLSRCLSREETEARTFSGILMGAAGVAVAWLSLTPWFSILGMMLAALGGVVAIGSNEGSDLIERFGRERVWAFALTFIGACVLAGERSAITMEHGFALANRPEMHFYDLLGGVLLTLGAFLFLLPVPFSDCLTRRPVVSSALNLIVAQIFSALAAFGLLTRFEPAIRALGIFEVFQWIALASVILGALSGFAQESWKTALPLWVSAALSFSFAALCSGGPICALPIVLGAVFGAASIAILGSAAEIGVFSQKASRWHRPLVFISIASGLGVIGFVSSGGYVRTLSLAALDPALLAVSALALLMTTGLLWKGALSSLSTKKKPEQAAGYVSVAPLICSGVILILALGLVWWGSLTGGAIPHDPDHVFSSWFQTSLGTQGSDWSDGAGVALGEAVFWSVIALFSIFSYWLFSGQDRVLVMMSRSPRVSKFLRNGYEIDKLGKGILKALWSVGVFLEKWLNQKISVEWIPRGIEKALRTTGSWIDWIDRKAYLQEESILRQWVDVPAKTVQIVQSGDLQWYLFFAISCVAAVLIHFLR